MAKQAKFDVASRVSTRPAAGVGPDDLLFGTPAAPEAPAPTIPTPVEMLRFGSQLPAPVLVKLHRLNHWRRDAIYELLDEALQMLYAKYPDQANEPLPEKERVKRKLPTA